MKKFLLVVLLLFTLCACDDDGKQMANPDDRYMYIIEMINEHESFQTTSNYFDIGVEMAKIENGYRHYNMAANVGIFEDKEYNMVPNQANIDDGFVKGIVVSGVSKEPQTTLYIFVQFKNADYSITRSEYFQLDASYEAEQ